MPSDPDIMRYYDRIAPTYDESRFSNSYGRYIHTQETAVLTDWLRGIPAEGILDLGCGTGRFLAFAGSGLDRSAEMLAVARSKFPDKNLYTGDAENTGFPPDSFSAVFSFHVFMHLDKAKTQAILDEMYRILRPGGVLVIDFPSHKRRLLSGRRQPGWHGANEFTPVDWRRMAGDRWLTEASRGILFFPVHRLPVFLRPFFRRSDSLLCRSPFKEYASYLVIRLRKK